ncbi:hypothetical protein D3C73_996170 [compost metagenome]
MADLYRYVDLCGFNYYDAEADGASRSFQRNHVLDSYRLCFANHSCFVGGACKRHMAGTVMGVVSSHCDRTADARVVWTSLESANQRGRCG